MKNNLVVIAILVLGFFGYRYFGDGEKGKIREIIATLEENLEFQKPLQPLSVLTRFRRIKPFISDNFTGRSESGKIQDINIDHIKTGAMIATKKFIKIDILTLPAMIDITGNTASANFKATIGGLDTAGQEFKELFDMTLDFIKTNGEWKCSGGSAKRQTDLVD